MQNIEPFYQWRELYTAEKDPQSPFYQRKYSETYYTNAIYNYVIHPQWDEFGSETLYIKVLYADYDRSFAVVEMFGEWNDAINNDIMFLKRDVLDTMMEDGINKFVLVGENILQFHGDTDDYYEEWYDDVEDGWIAAVNFRHHIQEQLQQHRLDYYINYGGELDSLNWRGLTPIQLFAKVEHIMRHRLA